MTATADDPETDAPPRLTIRQVLVGLFIAQALIGAALVALDVTGYSDTRTSILPTPASPIAPGDQTRRYDPSAVPSRGPQDGGRRRPFQLPTEMGALSFRFIDDPDLGRIMIAEGAITPGDADRFEAALQNAAPRPDVLALHSPGGSVRDALRIGQAVRDGGLNTMMTADATCASACPLILFSGVERRVSRDAWVGMHQSYLVDVSLVTTRQAVADIQFLQGDVLEHTKEMGIDPAVHIHAFQTPPDSIYYLVEDELTDYAVATEITD